MISEVLFNQMSQKNANNFLFLLLDGAVKLSEEKQPHFKTFALALYLYMGLPTLEPPYVCLCVWYISDSTNCSKAHNQCSMWNVL